MTPDPPASRLSPEEYELLRGFLDLAWRRAQNSLGEAQRLREAGFHSQAAVWAVRAVEIFTKEFMLMPAIMQRDGASVVSALRTAGRLFGSSGWANAYRAIEELCGSIDPMLTDTGEDAWRHWEREAVRLRGNIVHGRSECDAAVADWVLSYAERLLSQLAMRMTVSERHPARAVFVHGFERIRARVHAEGTATSTSPG